jgi:hypothetical protein
MILLTEPWLYGEWMIDFEQWTVACFCGVPTWSVAEWT